MHKTISAILICLFIFMIPLGGFSSYLDRKDPFLASALSWFTPGLGQIYVGESFKGSMFWLIDNTLFWGTILNIADIKIGLNRDVGFSFSIRFKKNVSKNRVMATVGLGLCYLAFHIYNVIDAADSAHAYNKKLYMRQYKREGLSFGVLPQGAAFQYSLSF